MTKCKCWYEVEIINFRSYGGTKDLQMNGKIIELGRGGLRVNKFTLIIAS
jgi:hypothetical protein